MLIDHSNQIQDLIRLSNTLDGTEPNIDTNGAKMIYVRSLLYTWRRDYVRSARKIATELLTEITQYMNIKHRIEQASILPD